MTALLVRLGVHPRPGFVRALAASPLVLLVVYLAARGWFYPLWPDTVGAIGHPFTADPIVLGGAWGGPTLVGAWAVHAAIALGVQAVCLALLRLLYRAPERGRLP
ncbi:hypothetical protein [Saccharothrix coeruleofusca]|uniref:Uncharacterized protein n=1 Tax=Saccharothrix coeruleofusca TaxID=33919 RepID=A0A918AV88_9PSEU|nr:hypothetical protein [Saccharothrix coeruleofusca]MBP2337302.1 hypothetical protein [Saccharothrix coeruleofusca]GGP81619.1 hypothetical protein GCM10010185_64540 [Saccharothrix coeruleofusca]